MIAKAETVRPFQKSAVQTVFKASPFCILKGFINNNTKIKSRTHGNLTLQKSVFFKVSCCGSRVRLRDRARQRETVREGIKRS